LTPEELEEARRLLKAARSDLRAADALAADAGQENDVVGFHAQQAVEKSIKAVLAASGVEIPYTHDVSFLLDVLADHEAQVPEAVAQAEWLTPWAAAMRKGAADNVSLDRGAAIDVAQAAVQWATRIVDGGRGEPAS
jgi:HEPN domain-containing protein